MTQKFANLTVSLWSKLPLKGKMFVLVGKKYVICFHYLK